MIDSHQVATALDERLDGLTALPPEHYLVAGRAARGRRRRRRIGGVAVLAAAGVLLATQLPLSAGDSGVAREHPAAVAGADGAVAPSSLSTLTVAAGVGDIDSFSTDEIPPWATEYGNHGPAAIAPDGRLWIAPEASVVRSIDDLLGAAPGVAHSYAIEVRWHDELAWWWSYQEEGSTDSVGTMDDADQWTTDFALWAENESRSVVDRPSFTTRLVRFADDRSTALVPQPGVEVVDQVSDVDTGDMEQYARRSAAEVVIEGHTYFVLANGRASGHAIYEPYEAAVAAPDLEGFLAFVAAGFTPQVAAP